MRRAPSFESLARRVDALGGELRRTSRFGSWGEASYWILDLHGSEPVDFHVDDDADMLRCEDAVLVAESDALDACYADERQAAIERRYDDAERDASARYIGEAEADADARQTLDDETDADVAAALAAEDDELDPFDPVRDGWVGRDGRP